MLACMPANREPSNQNFEIDREATVCLASRRFFMRLVAAPRLAMVGACATKHPRRSVDLLPMSQASGFVRQDRQRR
jgi:hypothetical protein